MHAHRSFKAYSVLLILLVLASIAVGYWVVRRGDSDRIEWPPLKNASEVAGTTIVPTLDTPLEDAGNAIWCATFQVAWNLACDDVVGGPLEVAGAESVAQRLNDSPVTKAVLPPGSYYAMAGAPEDGAVEEIHAEMAEKFPGVEPPTFEGAQGLVAYAYLKVAAEFTTPFEDRRRPIEFIDGAGQKTPVEGFSLYHGHDHGITYDQLEQIKVLFRETSQDPESRHLETFAIDLTADQDDTQVIVAVLPHADNLQAVLDNLEQRTSDYEGATEIRDGDTLGVPNVLFNLQETFNQLTGEDRLIENSTKLQGLFIDQAWQMIRFSLDKSGAIVESEAVLKAATAAAPMQERFYDYIADRPFLVVMKRRSEKYPYFAAWFGNAELLEAR
ncbi:hypothetical protein [Aeoliella sp.]|uniref:hypothetical protein n=1 Tax=Aeoliella sp. TaxID=2795800 RepID=UPI003CCBF01C